MSRTLRAKLLDACGLVYQNPRVSLDHIKDYYDDEYDFDDYRPAYRYGTYARSRYDDNDWDDRLERRLESGWEEFKGESRLAWEKAKYATRDAWHSVERALPGDFDNDGR